MLTYDSFCSFHAIFAIFMPLDYRGPPIGWRDGVMEDFSWRDGVNFRKLWRVSVNFRVQRDRESYNHCVNLNFMPIFSQSRASDF